MNELNPDRPVGEEARKAYAERLRKGFIAAFLSGEAILDIGYRGYRDDVVPIVPAAIGIELDYQGYDGVTLPFPAGSQDAVFASHCLEHIDDYQNAIREWFRVLKVGGHLLIMVPHKFLYEKQAAPPSRFNDDHKRFYTPASLMAEIEISLQPNSYRLRHMVDNDFGFDYNIPPSRHSGGCYELELVLEKIEAPSWHLAKSPAETALLAEAEPLREMASQADVIRYDFAVEIAPNPSILVLKLDHFGDFVIGLPSLRRLREAFPTSRITLLVGSWNKTAALASKLADAVLTYDYFPQNALGWDGKPHERLEKFQTLTAEHYDIAIDLRVDEDTRHLLTMVDAGLRCGIGAPSRHPFLDVAAPPEHRVRHQAAAQETRSFAVSSFESRMPFKRTFYHETDFRTMAGHVIYGPHVPLPLGPVTVDFDVRLIGWRIGWHLQKAQVTLDVARDGSEIVALRALRARDFMAHADDGVRLSFDNESAASLYEFRVHVAGALVRTRLRFAGVHLHQTAARARFQRSELHIGEQLSMLVQLIADRTRPLYDASPRRDPPSATKHIAIAPISNSDLRDWPLAHYTTLIRLLTAHLDCTITLLGTASQAKTLNRLAEAGGERVQSMGGQTSWAKIPQLLRRADLVICNNSGIAHLAASVGARTLAIYSGSHQPQEWGPRGQRSHALMSVVPCSPCGHDRLEDCPHEHRCMRGLTPETVFDHVGVLLSQPAAPPNSPTARIDTAH